MKLMTLNTHSLQEPHYADKLELFVETIRREQPDVIALQEVNQTALAPSASDELLTGLFPCRENSLPIREDNHAAHAARLLRHAGLECSWTYMPVKTGYGIYDEGLAFLCTGREITTSDSFYISGITDYQNWKTRRAAGIRIHGCDDWFYTVHTGWWQDTEEPFKDQWKRLNNALEQKRQNHTVWLSGDFNSPAELRGEGCDLILSDGWYDTRQLAAQKDESGVTVRGRIDGWREEHHPFPDGMRLDYIWCSRPAPVKSSRVIFNGSYEPEVSDHYGVIIETG